MRDVIELLETTEIPEGNSYIDSYPHMLAYFAGRDVLTESDVVVGAHIVYGWMPTKLTLHIEAAERPLERAALLLNAARGGEAPSDDQLRFLVNLINNSMVGASKLLHFAAPDRCAIWDSKICRFIFSRNLPQNLDRQIQLYHDYHRLLAETIARETFEAFHLAVNDRLGYGVSAFRAIELIMFLNAPTG